jgi:hypothetical protein
MPHRNRFRHAERDPPQIRVRRNGRLHGQIGHSEPINPGEMRYRGTQLARALWTVDTFPQHVTEEVHL